MTWFDFSWYTHTWRSTTWTNPAEAWQENSWSFNPKSFFVTNDQIRWSIFIQTQFWILTEHRKTYAFFVLMSWFFCAVRIDFFYSVWRWTRWIITLGHHTVSYSSSGCFCRNVPAAETTSDILCLDKDGEKSWSVCRCVYMCVCSSWFISCVHIIGMTPCVQYVLCSVRG